jgi:hypothetical protein
MRSPRTLPESSQLTSDRRINCRQPDIRTVLGAKTTTGILPECVSLLSSFLSPHAGRTRDRRATCPELLMPPESRWSPWSNVWATPYSSNRPMLCISGEHRNKTRPSPAGRSRPRSGIERWGNERGECGPDVDVRYHSHSVTS